MAEQKKTQETKVEETKEEVKEEKEMAKEVEETKDEEVKAKVKKEKPGFFKKVWNGIKRNKKLIGVAVVSAAAGIGGTLGVEKLGEMAYEKKHRNDAAIPMETYNQDNEVLSPNVDD